MISFFLLSGKQNYLYYFSNVVGCCRIVKWHMPGFLIYRNRSGNNQEVGAGGTALPTNRLNFVALQQS
jgi:hypothetical protein